MPGSGTVLALLCFLFYLAPQVVSGGFCFLLCRFSTGCPRSGGYPVENPAIGELWTFGPFPLFLLFAMFFSASLTEPAE